MISDKNENWCEVPGSGEADVNATVAAARAAFILPEWRGLMVSAHDAGRTP